MNQRQEKLLAMAEELLTTGGDVARASALTDLAREIRLSGWTPKPRTTAEPVKASGNGNGGNVRRVSHDVD